MIPWGNTEAKSERNLNKQTEINSVKHIAKEKGRKRFYFPIHERM